MKLSEAIRLGAMLKPQGFESVFSPIAGVTCALGAALDAVGEVGTKYIFSFHGEKMVIDRWPVASVETKCPCGGCHGKAVDVVFVIQTLNDAHKWTREQIADWVEQIEQQQERSETGAIVAAGKDR